MPGVKCPGADGRNGAFQNRVDVEIALKRKSGREPATVVND
jgi:hypothetical protein